MNEMKKARELFLKYDGSYFHMEQDGQLSAYKGYEISKNTEKEWLREHQEELISKIQTGVSIGFYLTKLCYVMRQYKDDEYFDKLINTIIKSLKSADTFVQLRIAEELLEVINFFILNNVGDREKLASKKNFAIDILKNIISHPIIISEETKKRVVFEDTLREKSIRERTKKRLNESLKKWFENPRAFDDWPLPEFDA